MGTPKPRILPWLVSQLDLGQLEGVAWVNETRTRFRIPWKHGLRQDAQEEDFRIFQAWAEATGAYVPGRDKPDLPTWKRNFRSALNRKDGLCLAEDRSKDPHDPHKIYEFVNSGLPDRGSCGRLGSQGFLAPLLPSPPFSTGVGDFSQPDSSPDTNGGGSTSDTQENILDELLGNMVLAPLPDPGPPSLAIAPQPLRSPSLDSPTPFPNLEPSENPLKRLLVPGEEWEFEVTAFYRGRQVFQQTISCPEGLRLVGSEVGDRTLPGWPITLPDPGMSLTDRGVMSYVRHVLSSLGGGLALRRAGQRLWAQRLGHCHTYWAVSEELLNSGHGPDGEVPKDKEGGVFDLGPFIVDLITFTEGSGRSPRYALWFCVGESWPQDQPWTKRLVMVKVVPTCLRALVEIARVGGASSLENTVDLHISNSHPLSLTSDQYKAYLQDLVEDMDFQGPGET
ncbi:interferon regulatory factor 3 isoform X1 [Macaca thibetana thibetana]|uniref:interferon regulatory factor 3 isoform X1 n=2 Tax=Macaca thibetana thibetana TaxID=257877 RepID=UPI0021BC7FE9|nr:interferon regulatory factor 3 isoform X1 [Macaca thibetana thibetana]XP_050627477.1 interferon regulatory factor 3 isoform X1 [Macaca thibetana thibetana]